MLATPYYTSYFPNARLCRNAEWRIRDYARVGGSPHGRTIRTDASSFPTPKSSTRLILLPSIIATTPPSIKATGPWKLLVSILPSAPLPGSPSLPPAALHSLSSPAPVESCSADKSSLPSSAHSGRIIAWISPWPLPYSLSPVVAVSHWGSCTLLRASGHERQMCSRRRDCFVLELLRI